MHNLYKFPTIHASKAIFGPGFYLLTYLVSLTGDVPLTHGMQQQSAVQLHGGELDLT